MPAYYQSLVALLSAAGAVSAFNGAATWYYTETGNAGACGAYSKNTDPVVALPPSQWANGAHCWQHIGIWYGNRWVDATVVDLCPSCEGNHIDLSPGAFNQLASPDTGLIQVYWNWE
ncbi:RlpA-like double-psi beta-barrel-protein domain-containing protein-containing protein [Schizophyllum fasciatum]